MYMKRLIAFAVAMAAMASFAVAEMRYGIAIPAGLSEIVLPRGGYMSSEAGLCVAADLPRLQPLPW